MKKVDVEAAIANAGRKIGGMVFRTLPISTHKRFMADLENIVKESVPTILISPEKLVKMSQANPANLEGGGVSPAQIGEEGMLQLAYYERVRIFSQHADELCQLVSEYSGHPIESIQQLTVEELQEAIMELAGTNPTPA